MHHFSFCTDNKGVKSIILMILNLFMAWSTISWANPPCPKSAGSLQAFQACFMGKTSSQPYLDHDHQQVMAIMAQQTLIPPQVIPGGPLYTTSPFPYAYYGITSLSGVNWAYFPAQFPR